jgi:hypothetical protein
MTNTRPHIFKLCGGHRRVKIRGAPGQDASTPGYHTPQSSLDSFDRRPLDPRPGSEAVSIAWHGSKSSLDGMDIHLSNIDHQSGLLLVFMLKLKYDIML